MQLTLFILDTGKQVLWQMVKTQMILFVCVDSLCLSQEFYSHVRTALLWLNEC